MDNKLSPTKVANLLSVSASTVRRLTGLYSDYFSPDATPAPGGRRFYNAEDVETLRTIIDMQNAGVDEPDIIARLDRGVTLPSEPTNVVTNLVEPFSPPPTLSIDTSALQDAISRQAAVQQVSIDVMRESNASMDKHSAALERLANSLVIFGAMILVAVLLTIAVAAGWL